MPAEPAAFQIAHLTTELMRATNAFNNNIEVFGNISSSIKNLSTMFSSSKIFKVNNVKSMSNFFKTAPNLYKKLISSVDTLNKSIISTENTNIQQPLITEEIFPVSSLIDRVSILSNNILDLSNSVDNIKLDISSGSTNDIENLQTDLSDLNNEMIGIINQITSSSKGINNTSAEVIGLNNDLKNTVEQFSNLASEGKITSQNYFEIIRRLNDVNIRLSNSQKNLNRVNSELSDSVDEQSDAIDNLDKGISSMVALQALDLFQGNQVGEVGDQISSLHDELIDLRKTMADVSLPIEEWRRSAIDTAKEFNKLGIATDPAEMAHLYSVVGKAGVRTVKDVQALAKSIKLVTEATDISAEEAAEFGYTLADSWGLGFDYIDKYNSMVIKMQSLHNVSANKIMDQTKDIGEVFFPVLDKLGKKGKEVFMVKLSNAVGSLESAFIKDKDLIQDMALSLSDPAQAAEKFADILQGTGYSVIQMASDLKRGDITKALEKVFQGSTKFANMSTEQLRIVSERSGKSIADLLKMSRKSGEVINNLAKLQTEGIEEISKGGINTLTKLAVEENKKLGSLFERIGKKIKTWISDVGIGAVEGLGVEILDLAPTIAPIIIVLDKLGLKLSWVGSLGKTVGSKLIGFGKNVFSYAAKSGGVISSLTGILSLAKTGIISLGASIYAALGPIGLIIAGITALTIAIIALIKYKDKILNMFGEKFPNATAKVSKFLGYLSNKFFEYWDIAAPIIKMLGKIIGTFLVKSFEILGSVGKIAFKVLEIGAMLLWKVIKPVIVLVGEAFSWLWSKIKPEDGLKSDDFNGWIKGAELLIGIIKDVGNIVLNFFNNIIRGLDLVINNFDLFVNDVLKKSLVDSFNFVVDSLMNLPSKFINIFKYIGNKVIDYISYSTSLISSLFINMFKSILNFPIVDYISSFISNIVDKFISFKDNIISIISEIPNKLAGIIKDSFTFLMENIGSIINKIADKIKSLPGISWITSLFGGNKPEAMARGGLATSPSIVGEKGPEWIIPTYNPDRNRFFKDVGMPLEREFIKTFTKEIPMVDGTKIIEPVVEKKIFTEKPENIINVNVDSSNNGQKDVVEAIKELTSIIQKAQIKKNENDARIYRQRNIREKDEQAELVSQWAI